MAWYIQNVESLDYGWYIQLYTLDHPCIGHSYGQRWCFGGFNSVFLWLSRVRLITRFDVSPGPENVKAVFAFTPDSVPEKLHTKILPLQWGETAERMPFGEPVFLGNPQAWQKVPNSNPSAIEKIADALHAKRRSTGVWNEGWCKVGGITQRVFWMLKAWLSSSNKRADAAGAMCQAATTKNPFRLSFFTKNQCAAKATV